MRLMTGLSWVKAENLHVTLRFLGDLGDSGVRRAGEAAGRGAKGHAAFTARLGAPGAFPSMNRPRVLWTGLTEGRDEAIALAKSVNQSLDHGGFGPADKPFKPHITLARVRERAEGVEAFGRYTPPPPPGAALLDRIVVMKRTRPRAHRPGMQATRSARRRSSSRYSRSSASSAKARS